MLDWLEIAVINNTVIAVTKMKLQHVVKDKFSAQALMVVWLRMNLQEFVKIVTVVLRKKIRCSQSLSFSSTRILIVANFVLIRKLTVQLEIVALESIATVDCLASLR